MSSDLIDAIDKESGKGRFQIGFSADLEKLYRCDWTEQNYKSVSFSLLVATLLASTFIISDYFVAKSSFLGFLIARFGVTLPICLFCINTIKNKKNYAMVAACLVPITMAAALSVMLAIGEGAYRSTYLFGDILLMITGCVLIRPVLQHAVATVGVQYLFYQGLVFLPGLVAPGDQIVSSLFGMSGAIVAILAVFALEQFSRRSFVLSLRVKLLNEQLRTMTLTDPLTRLANRRSFDEATDRFWEGSKTNGSRASFILIDIDRFKAFNDNYGHPAGDLCLTVVARSIAARMREGRDLAFRFGGEEFLVFLPETDFAEARLIAEGVRLAILDAAIPHPILSPDAVVSASLGVATALTSDVTPLDLITRADQALYAANNHGRNRIWPPLDTVHLNGAQSPASPGLRKVA